MDIVFVEYIETSKFGKIAHFVDSKGNNIYSKILYKDEVIYYQELSSNELETVKDEIHDKKS